MVWRDSDEIITLLIVKVHVYRYGYEYFIYISLYNGFLKNKLHTTFMPMSFHIFYLHVEYLVLFAYGYMVTD